MYQALYRKYRPNTFSDVVGQEHITDILKNQIKTDRVSHAYIFTGTRGTGKTSCAKILAKAANCLSPIDGNPCNKCAACVSINSESSLDVLEIDAASNNKVDDIRGILEETKYTPAVLKKRVYIIDEVHMLTTQAFNALLKTLEEPPAHILFILATTEIHKVLPTILSRCQRFDFKRITPKSIENRLLYVAEKEGLNLNDDAAKIVAKLADGGLRDALSILDRCITDENITAEVVCKRVGNVSFDGLINLAKYIKNCDPSNALVLIDELYNSGIEIVSLLKQLLGLYRDLLIANITGDNSSHLLYAMSLEEFENLKVSNESLEKYIKTITSSLLVIQKSVSKKIDVEICIITLCKPINDTSTPVEKRMQELEDKISNFKPIINTVETPTRKIKKEEVLAEDTPKMSILEVKGEQNQKVVDEIFARISDSISKSILAILKKCQIFFDKKNITIAAEVTNHFDQLNQNKMEIDRIFREIFKEDIIINIINSKNKKLIAKKDDENNIDILLDIMKKQNVEILEE